MTSLNQTSGDGQLQGTGQSGTNLVLSEMAVIARAMFEYRHMFLLNEGGMLLKLLETPNATVLDLPSATSTFARQLRNMANRAGSTLEVYSADIVYNSTPQEIYEVACETAKKGLNALMEKNSWEGSAWPSQSMTSTLPSEWLAYRLSTYQAWLDDITNPKNSENYIQASFPNLENLQDKKFNLILSSNCLFAYEKVLVPGGTDEDVFNFHLTSLTALGNLLKPEGEARIYPLGSASVPMYSQMTRLIEALEAQGFRAEIKDVPEPPNVAAWDKMLIIRRNVE